MQHDVEHDPVQVNHQTEQIEVDRSKSEPQDVTARDVAEAHRQANPLIGDRAEHATAARGSERARQVADRYQRAIDYAELDEVQVLERSDRRRSRRGPGYR